MTQIINVDLNTPCGVITEQLNVIDPSVVGDVSRYDWTMPNTALRSDEGGLLWFNFNNTNSARAEAYEANVFGVATPAYVKPRFAPVLFAEWDAIEISQGVYDFTALDALIAYYNTLPVGIGFTIDVRVHGNFIPLWVDPIFGTDFINDGNDCWNSKTGATYNYNTLVQPFLAQISARYATEAKLVGCVMSTPWSKTFGEWSLIGVPLVGTNVDVLDFTQAYYNVFKAEWLGSGGNSKKLISKANNRKYNATGSMIDWLKTNDFGERDGLPQSTEYWEPWENCTLVNDRVVYSEPLFFSDNNDVVTFSEVTEYTYSSSLHSPPEHTLERFMIGLLYSLSIRRSWLAFSTEMYEIIGGVFYNSLAANLQADFDVSKAMIDWTQYQVAQKPDTAYDAWSFLNETNYGGGGPNWYQCNSNFSNDQIIINVERWLYQHDNAVDGKTQRVIATATNEIGGSRLTGLVNAAGVAEQWKAREMTDQYCYFECEDLFLAGGPFDVELKVTYLSINGVKLAVEYNTPAGVLATPIYTDIANSNDWHTVTFHLCYAMFDGAFVDGRDFRVVNEGTINPYLRFVRIIKV